MEWMTYVLCVPFFFSRLQRYTTGVPALLEPGYSDHTLPLFQSL